MKDIIAAIESAIAVVSSGLPDLSDRELTEKRFPDKWSKKEIFGHLTDSALNNLKRFTECTHSNSDYVIVPYPQNHLVKANNYQNRTANDLLMLWTALNRQIIFVIQNLTESDLNHTVVVGDNKKTLKWLIQDYADHMDHHVKQILSLPVR